MASEIIKKHLAELREQNRFDPGFIAILAESNETDDDGDTMARKILKLIRQRYAESKENKT